MMQETWTEQKLRLIDRFGERNFSKEFSLLVALECKNLPDNAFVDLVNAMIGSRRPNNPPLISDFRNARLSYERRIFERDTSGALRALDIPWQNGLQAYLAKEFPGCKTLNEAVEVRKLQIQIARAENLNYDPLTDPKWNLPDGAA